MQPMTPHQLEALRQRMGIAQNTLSGPLPTDIGSGLQRMGTAVGLAAMRSRYNSQFPSAPVAAGGMPAPAQPPIQGFLENISGNQMPWQFPTAPTAPGASPVADTTGWGSPMTSLRQGDQQQPAAPSMPMVQGKPGPSGTGLVPETGGGGVFGLLSNVFQPKTPAGLW